MIRFKTSLLERIIAILLVVAIAITALPSSSLIVVAAEDGSDIATTITLSGTVTDQTTGEGIEGVTVELSSETADAVVTGTVTAADGTYSVSLTKNAAYTVSFSKAGYKIGSLQLTDADTDADKTDGNIGLEAKAADDTLVFMNENNEAETAGTITYGDAFTVKAVSSNQPDASVTYKSSDETSATVDSDTGVVTALKSGTVTITATIEENDEYTQTEVNYALTIEKAQLPAADFYFSESGIIQKNMADASYTQEVYMSDAISLTGTISYSLAQGNEAYANIDASTGTVNFIKPGTVTVSATIVDDEKYTGTASYTLEIQLQEDTDFKFASDTREITYDKEEKSFQYAPEGVDDTVTYSILSEKTLDGTEVAAGTIAAIDASTGELTIEKSGIVEVKAVKAANSTYGEAEASYTLTILKADQTGFAFKTPEPESIKYNENNNLYTNEATGGESSGAVTYTVDEAYKDYVTIEDETKPELTIKKPGTVQVKATKAGDDCYNEVSNTYTLTIEKADQTIQLENGTAITGKYGSFGTTYVNKATEVEDVTKPDMVGHGTGAITYALTEGAVGEGIVKKFDATTGEITFSDGAVGSVTVTATKAGDDYYEECSESYTLEVVYEETPTTPYILEGETKNTSGWYTGKVTVKAPSGYCISKSNALGDDNTWAESLTYEQEGENKDYKIYLKNKETEGITDVISVETLKIDKTAPVIYDIAYEETLINKVLET